MNHKIIAAVAMARYPVPINVKQVRQFLGLASFYHKFVPGLICENCPTSPYIDEEISSLPLE